MASLIDGPSEPRYSGPPRFQQGPITTGLQLGPLASLVGNWRGSGFNAIWRPDNNQPPELSAIHRFLELNLTSEALDFQVIPGVVPNRGFNTQPDLNLYGLHYLQRISDADPAPPPFDPQGYSQTAGQALHIEPGLFMNVPGSQATGGQATIVRMGSVPHGVSVMMQGPNPGPVPVPGPPAIPPLVPFAGYPGLQAFTTPVLALGIQPINVDGSEHVVPEVDIASDVVAPGSQSTGPYPPSFQGFVADPNSVLRDAIAGQDILGTITINLTSDGLSTTGLPTDGAGSGIETVENIPFLGVANPDPAPPSPGQQPAAAATQTGTTPNAFVYSSGATFWIEWVRIPHGVPPVFPHDGHHPLPEALDPARLIEPFWEQPTYLQLQYSQLVILIFNGVLWPHVTVATLRLSAG